MPTNRHVAIAICTAWVLTGMPASAQETGEGNREPASTTEDQPSSEEILSEEEEMERGAVEVSLGDWDIRTRLSEELSVPIADLPLTISLDPDLAGDLCPIRERDLEQQVVVSAIRTCAAKTYDEQLLDAVREDLEANPPEDHGS